MARTKQKLIHLHSTTPLTLDRANGVNMAVGEIAVQAAATKEDSSLWILTANSGDVAQFPSVDKVKSLISGATSTDISGLKTAVDELQGTVSGYTSTNTVKAAIDGVKNDLQGKINTINGLIGSGVTGSNITAELAAVKNTANTANQQATTNKGSIETINSALSGLTGPSAVLNAINAAKTKVVAATDGVTSKFLAVSGDSTASGVTYTLTLTDVASAQGLSDLSKKVETNETNITALKALHAEGKTVAEEVADGIAKVVADAPTDFDTLKEIADWIKNDKTGAASMSNDIAALKNALNGYISSNAVQNAFTTVNGNISTINSVLKGLSGESAVSNAINAAKTEIEIGINTGVKVEEVTPAAADGHVKYKISGVGLATDENLSALSGTVDTLKTDLNTEVIERKNADTDIQNQIGTGFTTTTVTEAVAKAKTKVAADTGTSTTNFLELSNDGETNPTNGVTYTIKLKDVASAGALSTLDAKTVKFGEINVDAQKFTGTFASNKLSFNLSTLVIDCGEY